MDSSHKFFVIRRANGETFYFNLAHVAMVFDNPEDRVIQVVGAGFEKNFHPNDAKPFVEQLRKAVINPDALKAATPLVEQAVE
jgi:type 1 glutamine amidotransferase